MKSESIEKLARRIDFQNLQTSPGSYWCLHVSTVPLLPKPDLESQLVELAESRDQNITIARPAQSDRSLTSLFRRQSSVGWLVKRGLGTEEAADAIAGLGVRVHEILDYNAGDPRSLLGMAAALATNSEILLYSTCGMSPAGREAAHEFMGVHRGNRCVIHLAPSLVTVRPSGPKNANRFCPISATCVNAITESRDRFGSGS